ncbi:NAD(P)/FAD-dependent oxidoreductase [Microbacterium arborescens]|uniref:NAD(P)/FAD-dependent oxidoreductase n=1 Tax=Microbacterium arborescens TaxID=33883 RepID=UPI002783DAD8|nr:FAD/NAD(P)-binding oxidoreductase [Microbacterium arborescens]MDQ1218366.1 3-phenylpropionate/trans-cinnamate dioxygenase ferredoxin reductase subunit [Microbacterium arborescens]
MQSYDYLIVGGGMVADAAARGIRALDESGTIGILSADVDEPYTRPALTKKLWTDPDFTWDQVPLGTADATGADIRLQTLVTAIDRDGRTVEVGDGERIGYRRLLLATGSRPREIDAPDDDRVLFFRSADDYRRLRELAAAGERIVVVGGGYIGAELAAALVQNGVAVDLVFPSAVLGDGTFPPVLAERYEDLFRAAGVRLVADRRVAEVVEAASADDALDVVLDDGSRLRGDAVVLGLGVSPVTDLAEAAGLAVDDGVVVDELLATSDDAIWAAGDIASYPDRLLGRTRVEHVDNAQEMGRAAGRAMAGSGEAYRHTPSFYSQVFGVRWEAVGTLDPDLDTLIVDVGQDESGPRTVVYYRDETGAPVGVLLWNVAGATDAARLVLAESPTAAAELRGRIA